MEDWELALGDWSLSLNYTGWAQGTDASQNSPTVHVIEVILESDRIMWKII